MSVPGTIGEDVRRLIQWPPTHPMQASLAIALGVFCVAFLVVTLGVGGQNRAIVGLAQLVVLASWLITFLVFKRMQRHRLSLGEPEPQLVEESSDA